MEGEWAMLRVRWGVVEEAVEGNENVEESRMASVAVMHSSVCR